MPRRSRALVSFLAVIIGWTAGTGLFLLTAWLVWGSFADVDVVVLWTIPFAAIGWLVFFLPIAFFFEPRGAVFTFPAFAFVGACLGVVAFALLVGWWAPLWQESYVYLAHPAVLGFVAGTVYSGVMRRASHSPPAV